MKSLSPYTHGILDYITVMFLAISPSLFNMQHAGALFTYALAVVHLLLTLITRFPAGLFRIVPLRIHGLIELIVSIALVGISIWFRLAGDIVSAYYYLSFSVLLFIVWAVSDYRPLLASEK